MLQIRLEGWFQCRLATNPDPTDEPRGVSGYTFALPGEPDLDRIIRLQDPVAPRSHGPHVGVKVTHVFRDGSRDAAHPLNGARVSFIDDARFESRNQLLTRDRAGVGLIHPFHIEIAVDGVVIKRKDHLDPENPSRELHESSQYQLHRRAPTTLDGMLRDMVRISEATGISDVVSYRRRRRERLEVEFNVETDPVRRAALQKRISELAITSPDDMRIISMQVYQARSFEINGPAEIIDRDGLLDEHPTTDHAWPIEFWMGAWDADALCGYMSGMLTFPLSPT